MNTYATHLLMPYNRAIPFKCVSEPETNLQQSELPGVHTQVERKYM